MTDVLTAKQAQNYLAQHGGVLESASQTYMRISKAIALKPGEAERAEQYRASARELSALHTAIHHVAHNKKRAITIQPPHYDDIEQPPQEPQIIRLPDDAAMAALEDAGAILGRAYALAQGHAFWNGKPKGTILHHLPRVASTLNVAMAVPGSEESSNTFDIESPTPEAARAFLDHHADSMKTLTKNLHELCIMFDGYKGAATDLIISLEADFRRLHLDLTRIASGQPAVASINTRSITNAPVTLGRMQAWFDHGTWRNQVGPEASETVTGIAKQLRVKMVVPERKVISRIINNESPDYRGAITASISEDTRAARKDRQRRGAS